MLYELSVAVNQRLSSLFTPENVFSGKATNDSTLPYIGFTFLPATNEQEFAGLITKGTIFNVPLQIDLYYKSYEQVSNNIVTIQKSLKNNYPDITPHNILSISIVDFEILEEDEMTQEGERVYRGVLMLDVKVIYG